MLWTTPREIPPSFPRRVGNAYFKGSRLMREGILFGVPLVAMEAAAQQKGEILPTLTGRLAGLAAQPVMAGMASAALTATISMPPAAAAMAGTILAGYVSTQVENRLINKLSSLQTDIFAAQHVAFGGDYQDTLTAQKRRQRALRDITGAMLPARQWLGREALLLHR